MTTIAQNPPVAGGPPSSADGTDRDLTSIRRTVPVDWAAQVDLFAIVKLDSGGVVRGWNLGAQRIKGYTEDEIVGTHFSSFYRREDRRRGTPDALMAAAQRDGHAEDTGWRVRKDGSEFWARVTISAIRNDIGEVLGFVKIVRDLTSEKSEADEQRAQLRMFAHDLLSPVTALRGYIDLLGDHLPPDHRLLRRASDASEHLVAMAKALMVETKASTAHDRRTTTLDVIARGAVALVLPGENTRRVRFGRMEPVPVNGDVLGLRRAIANVLENAAKYSDDMIVVQVYATAEGATVSVSDEGRGIHPDDIALVVQDGERGRFADDRDGGSGIGLASVQRLVGRHDGSLRIHSRVGEGTTVAIALPRAED